MTSFQVIKQIAELSTGWKYGEEGIHLLAIDKLARGFLSPEGLKVCGFGNCLIAPATQCECCGKEYFCDDHGTSGNDDSPAHCWKCGGFNADEDGVVQGIVSARAKGGS